MDFHNWYAIGKADLCGRSVGEPIRRMGSILASANDRQRLFSGEVTRKIHRQSLVVSRGPFWKDHGDRQIPESSSVRGMTSAAGPGIPELGGSRQLPRSSESLRFPLAIWRNQTVPPIYFTSPILLRGQ